MSHWLCFTRTMLQLFHFIMGIRYQSSRVDQKLSIKHNHTCFKYEHTHTNKHFWLGAIALHIYISFQDTIKTTTTRAWRNEVSIVSNGMVTHATIRITHIQNNIGICVAIDIVDITNIVHSVGLCLYEIYIYLTAIVGHAGYKSYVYIYITRGR